MISLNEFARRRGMAGVTLLELLIVLAIIAIISSFAYPSYLDFVTETKRTAATSALMQIADKQQQFFMDRKTYADDLTDLGYGTDPMVITDDGSPTIGADPDSVYIISLSDVAATTYTATATPLHGQLKRDTECGSLTLDQAGTRGSVGPDCWN